MGHEEEEEVGRERTAVTAVFRMKTVITRVMKMAVHVIKTIDVSNDDDDEEIMMIMRKA